MVVIVLPCGQFETGLMQCSEQSVVQLLVLELAVETFNKAILLGLAGSNIVLFNLGLISPVQNCVVCELGTIVADHHLRHSMFQHRLIEFSGNTSA